MAATAHRVAATAAALALLGSLAACSDDGVLALEVGDCLDRAELAGPEVTTVTPLGCSEPHDAEVFAAITHDGDFPGAEELRVEAEERCTAEFEGFVGLPYAESELSFSVLSPTEDGWERAGDRESLCVLLLEESVSESLEGAAR